MLKFWKSRGAEAPAGERAAEAEAPPPAEASPTPADPAAERAPGFGERLRGSALARGLGGLFRSHPKLDESLVEEIETCLLTADVGVAATAELCEDIARGIRERSFADSDALLAHLRARMVAMLEPVAEPIEIPPGVRPFVILVVGINGAGKTTSIGKLAWRYLQQGREVMLAAGDTFRAAAVEQLRTWGERNEVEVVAQGTGADAAAVVYDALDRARARGVDVLIADTAGRLHTQGGLMEELAKIRRVMQRLDPATPHEVLMVIDGTTGQNAISQVRQFRETAGVTGLVVTKLDGSARGGVVFALAREFGLPIRYVGLGEKAQDLRVFDPRAFVDAILPESLAGA